MCHPDVIRYELPRGAHVDSPVTVHPVWFWVVELKECVISANLTGTHLIMEDFILLNVIS